MNDGGEARARTEPVELYSGTQRADLLYSTATGVVVHLEIQQVRDPAMGRRMTAYAARIITSPRFANRISDLVQIVVQVSGTPMPTAFHLGGLTNTVRLIHLPTTPADVLLATASLSPFLLTRGDERLLAPVIASIDSVDDMELKRSLSTLAVYLAPHLRAKLVENLRRSGMIDTIPEMIEELRDTEIGTTFRQEGRQVGRQEGGLAMLVGILTARFPDAEPDIVTSAATRLMETHGSNAGRAALVLTDVTA